MNTSLHLTLGLIGSVVLLGGSISATAATITDPVRPARIGIDARHGDSSTSLSENLATGYLYGEFRSIIGGAGHTLINLTSFDAASLAGLDALIMRQSPEPTGVYTPTEITDIVSFVSTGHGLLLMADGGWSSNSTVDNINAIAGQFGVTFGLSQTGGSGFTVDQFNTHEVTEGVGSVGFDYFRPMSAILDPAIDLTVQAGDSDALAVVDGVNGAGNVVLLGDASLWATGNDRPITFGDNARFLENSVALIVPEPGITLLGLMASLVLCGRRRRS